MSTPSVLFICVSNGVKSQLATALAKLHSPTKITAYSAGTQPAAELDPETVTAIAEIGFDISDEVPKPVDPDLLRSVDRIVFLGPHAHFDIPDDARGTLDRWDIPDPADNGITGIERIRLIRDDIDKKVLGLLNELVP